jgi:hypothetical protein
MSSGAIRHASTLRIEQPLDPHGTAQQIIDKHPPNPLISRGAMSVTCEVVLIFTI